LTLLVVVVQSRPVFTAYTHGHRLKTGLIGVGRVFFTLI
jgi:hypothetical protein